MQKLKILQGIHAAGLVAIVRAATHEQAHALARACIDGGVTALEIAFTTPGTPALIEALRRDCGDQVLIGAGTVLDEATARIAILAGAQFIISPGVVPAVIRASNRYQIPSLPGAMTPTEIVAALEAGADIVKIFPGEAFGPSYVKALLAPLPHAPLMPTGGVTLANLADWFENGSVAVGVGGSLTGPARNGDYAAVTANARAFVQRMEEIRRSI